MPDVTVNIDLWCARCGAGICNNGTARKRGGGFDIEPCDKCLQEARSEGYDEGRAESA